MIKAVFEILNVCNSSQMRTNIKKKTYQQGDNIDIKKENGKDFYGYKD